MEGAKGHVVALQQPSHHHLHLHLHLLYNDVINGIGRVRVAPESSISENTSRDTCGLTQRRSPLRVQHAPNHMGEGTFSYAVESGLLVELTVCNPGIR